MTTSESIVWLILGLGLGATIGGLLVYALLSREGQSVLKTFTYDSTGRLIQVYKDAGV